MLAARTGMNWPGAKAGEADFTPGRRRLVPPGVPDPAVWGDRDEAQPSPVPTRRLRSRPPAVGLAGGARELSRLVASMDPVDQ